MKADQIPAVISALSLLANAVHQNAVEHEFHDFSEADTVFMNRELMNLIGETTELREAERSGTLNSPCDKADKMRDLGIIALTCLEEEYADIVIRAFDQLSRLKKGDISVGEIILAKYLYNRTRPIKHGRATA